MRVSTADKTVVTLTEKSCQLSEAPVGSREQADRSRGRVMGRSGLELRWRQSGDVHGHGCGPARHLLDRGALVRAPYAVMSVVPAHREELFGGGRR